MIAVQKKIVGVQKLIILDVREAVVFTSRSSAVTCNQSSIYTDIILVNTKLHSGHN